jgi:hypothetical protein
MLKLPGREFVIELYVVPRLEMRGDLLARSDAVYRHRDKLTLITTLNLVKLLRSFVDKTFGPTDTSSHYAAFC